MEKKLITSTEYVLEDKRVDCLSIVHTTKPLNT